MKRVTNLAHELYSHVSFFLDGKDAIHRRDKNELIIEQGEYIIKPIETNIELENRVEEAETEAAFNFLLNNIRP